MTLTKNASGEFNFRNPKWTTSDTIEVEVEHEKFGWIPFNATPYDEMDYGRELFELLSTKYLATVPMCPQSEKDAEQAEAVVMQRNQLLIESDWTVLPDVVLSNRDEWVTYRQALRDITDQPGHPWDVVWPQKPAAPGGSDS